jgi:hypothetical protein
MEKWRRRRRALRGVVRGHDDLSSDGVRCLVVDPFARTITPARVCDLMTDRSGHGVTVDAGAFLEVVDTDVLLETIYLERPAKDGMYALGKSHVASRQAYHKEPGFLLYGKLFVGLSLLHRQFRATLEGGTADHIVSYPVDATDKDAENVVWLTPKEVARVLERAMPDARINLWATCWACGRKEATLRKCGACRSAYYCDTRCQLADWKAHKGCLCAALAKSLPHTKEPEKRLDLIHRPRS